MGAQGDPSLPSISDRPSTARGKLLTARSNRECAIGLGGATEQRSWQHDRQDARCRSLERPRCHGTLPRRLAKGWAARISRNKLLLEAVASAPPHRRQTGSSTTRTSPLQRHLDRRLHLGTSGRTRSLYGCASASEPLSGRLPPLRQCAHSRRRFHRCAPHRILSIAERKRPGTLACRSRNE
jgi:hypothetical protein